MEFLVNIEIAWPPDADPIRRKELFAAEVERGQQLARQGGHFNDPATLDDASGRTDG